MKEEPLELDNFEYLDKDAKELYKGEKAPNYLRAQVLSRQKNVKTPARDIAKLVFLFGIPTTIIGGSLWWRNANTLPPIDVPKVIMPNPNAHDTLIEAHKALGGGIKTWSIEEEEKPKESLAERKQIIAKNQKAFAMVRQALGQEFQQPMGSTVLEYTTKSSGFTEYRELARQLFYSSLTEAETENLPAASQYGVDAVAMGMKIPKGGNLVSFLVGTACENMGYIALWKVADELDAKTLRATIVRLESLEKTRIPITEAMAGEKYWSAELIREMNPFTKEGMSLITITQGGGENHSPLELVPILLTPRRSAYEANQKFMDENIAFAQKPYDRHARIPEAPSDAINQRIIPVFISSWAKEAQIKTQSALLRTYLALRLYKLERKKYPDHLDDLVKSGYLTKSPVDAYGADRPLGYKQQGKNIILYSVGPDGKDDNGTPIDPNYASMGVEPGQKKKLSTPRRYVQEGDMGDMVARINTY
jgi:hypothetical protein